MERSFAPRHRACKRQRQELRRKAMRTLLAGAVLLSMMGCASAGGPGVQKQRSLLTIWPTTAADSFSGPHLDVYDRGLLVFSQRGDEMAAIDGETAAAFRRLVRERGWKKLFAALERQHYGDGIGQAGIFLQGD